MAVYFLGHGQTEANLEKVFAGQRDNSPLTELGIEQGRQAGHKLKGADIARITSSSLQRCHITAEKVAGVIGVTDLRVDDRIIEYDMGSLTGSPYTTISSSKELVSAEGAEDVSEFQKRVLDFLREYRASKLNSLMVSHAGVGRIIKATRQDLDPRTFYDLPPYPAGHPIKLDLSWLS
ncbi:MAG TPA: histidine phosphatase family protein [Candidatus Saccharimonadales bacterium]|nr:histidine phosphatase family protein [Candidatus Saccharimonadales bacterium]